MNDELSFFLFLLERYAAARGKKASEVLAEWDEHQITEEIYHTHELYHQEKLENALADIDHLLATGRHAW